MPQPDGTMTKREVLKRLVPPHAAWCAWVFDQVQMYARGLFPVLEHECNCPRRQTWLGA